MRTSILDSVATFTILIHQRGPLLWHYEVVSDSVFNRHVASGTAMTEEAAKMLAEKAVTGHKEQSSYKRYYYTVEAS